MMVYNVDTITAESPPYNKHATLHHVSIAIGILKKEVDMSGGEKSNWRG